MARRNRTQGPATFDWASPQEDADPAIGPNWSSRSTRRTIADPWSGDRATHHEVTAEDHNATKNSEAARWPAGEAERADIGFASSDALQAAHSNVDPAPLVAAAAEIAVLNHTFAAPGMTREQAGAADVARQDQDAARLREIAQLEAWLSTPGDSPND